MLNFVEAIKEKVVAPTARKVGTAATAAAFLAGVTWGVNLGYNMPRQELADAPGPKSWKPVAHEIQVERAPEPEAPKIRYVLQPPPRPAPQPAINRAALFGFHASQARSSLDTLRLYYKYNVSRRFAEVAMEVAKKHLGELYHVCWRNNISFEAYNKLNAEFESLAKSVNKQLFDASITPHKHEPAFIAPVPQMHSGGGFEVSEAIKNAAKGR
ncbi:MAG: hypothetical protein LBG89_02525 [Rickettsiales bacterium]|jgi:hypothetical protein|nr:hypothetical protein [Rickettsiales bacterium]